ncbi:MAG: protein translocase subunit SecF [Caldisericaceae bacterium]
MKFRDRISQWDIIGRTKLWFSISITVIIIGLVSMVVNQVRFGSPLNLGIDFKGGTIINVTCAQTPDTTKVSKILSGLGYKDAIIQEAQGNKITIKLNASMISADDVNKIINSISTDVSKVDSNQTSITSIAPVIGTELEKSGAIALGLALLFILFYISIRFQFEYALATVLALFHDMLITLGMLSLFRIELNAPFIGAFLAIITYSVEDTVVVMDRIREKLKFKAKESFRELVNKSITEVWIRSMNTSITTFFSSFALVLFGGPTLRDFSMTLLFGLTSGTYSSIYIASPLLVLWKKDKTSTSSESFVKAEKQIPAEVQLPQEEALDSSKKQQVAPAKKAKYSKKKSTKKRH